MWVVFVVVWFFLEINKTRNLSSSCQTFSMQQNHMEDFLQHLVHKASDLVDLGGDHEFAFLAYSQVILMLLVQGPHRMQTGCLE